MINIVFDTTTDIESRLIKIIHYEAQPQVEMVYK